MADMAGSQSFQTPPEFRMPISPNIPQTIIVNYPKPSNKRKHFKQRPAFIIGILLICCAVLAIIVQVESFILHSKKIEKGYFFGGAGSHSMSGVWTSPFVFLAGSFGLVSARTKRTGFIITTLVLGILSAVFVVSVFSYSMWSVISESTALLSNDTGAFLVNTTLDDVVELRHLIKRNNAAQIFQVMFGLTEFICSIVLSALCCAVVCCFRKSQQRTETEVMYVSPGGYVGSGVVMPAGQSVTGQPPLDGMNLAAAGGDLPPSYSTSEINKVGLTNDEGEPCPVKQPIPTR